MTRRRIRRSLAWGLTATLGLPIVLAVVLGLGGLLHGLGDEVGGAACQRIGLALGAAWGAALAVTTACNALAILDGEPRPPRRRRRRRRRASSLGRRIRRDLEAGHPLAEPDRPS